MSVSQQIEHAITTNTPTEIEYGVEPFKKIKIDPTKRNTTLYLHLPHHIQTRLPWELITQQTQSTEGTALWVTINDSDYNKLIQNVTTALNTDPYKIKHAFENASCTERTSTTAVFTVSIT